MNVFWNHEMVVLGLNEEEIAGWSVKPMRCDLMFVLVVMLLLKLVETKGYTVSAKRLLCWLINENHAPRALTTNNMYKHWQEVREKHAWQETKKDNDSERVTACAAWFWLELWQWHQWVISYQKICKNDTADMANASRWWNSLLLRVPFVLCELVSIHREVFMFTKHIKQCKTIYLAD